MEDVLYSYRDRQEREEVEREGRVVKEEELDDNMDNPFQPINNVVTEVGYHKAHFFYTEVGPMIKIRYHVIQYIYKYTTERQ